MKNRRVLVSVIALASIYLISLSAGHCFLKGDMDADDKISLVEAISSLQVVSGMRSAVATKVINVPGDFATIQEAIDAATEGDTINVAAGTYNEKLDISKNNITLQGAGKDTTIITGPGDGKTSTVDLKNVKGILIDGFLIKGGKNGIGLIFSSLDCQNCRLEDNTSGLRAYHNSYLKMGNSSAGSNTRGVVLNSGSTVYIYDSEISQNSEIGLNASGGANVEIEGCTISDNAGDGISANDSYLDIYTSTVSNNGSSGITAWLGSSIFIKNSQVSLNKSLGLNVSGHSSFHLKRGNTISGNATDSGWGGIGIYHVSYVFVEDDNNITQNNGPGIIISNNSTLDMSSGIIDGNQGHGIEITSDATTQLSSSVAITNNTGYGINCNDGKIISGTPENISGNTLGTTNGCN